MLFAMNVKKKLTIEACEMDVWSLFPADAATFSHSATDLKEVSSADIVISRDPRLPFLGYRILSRLPVKSLASLQSLLCLSSCELEQRSSREYRQFLHSHGVGEGPEDHPHGLAFPMECNADLLNGMSFTKGMHTGDWLTGRNLKRGIRERLMPVRLEDGSEGKELARGSQLRLQDGTVIGVIRSISGTSGLACLQWKQVARAGGRLQVVHEMTGRQLETRVPDWWRRGVMGLPFGHPRRFPFTDVRRIAASQAGLLE